MSTTMSTPELAAAPETTATAPVQTVPLISVVLPCSGSAVLLARSISALVGQSLARNLYEIIIVEATPGQQTRHVVASWRARTYTGGPTIIYLDAGATAGRAAARNRGWRHARGSIIAFTDDDTLPSPNWLLNALDVFDDHTDALYGHIERSGPAAHGRGSGQVQAREFVTANCFCRKSALEAVGGFDERFCGGWREDTDLQFRLLGNNVTISYAPHASVVQPLRPASWAGRLMQVDKIAFDALLYKKHPLMYRQKIRSAARLDYYTATAALLACALAAAAGNRTLALAGAAVWSATTLMLCQRRLQRRRVSASLLAETIVTAALLPPLAVFWRTAGAIRYRVRLA